MKRPLAYITAAWSTCEIKNTADAAIYSRAIYEAGYSPICPVLYMPLFINGEIPEEHTDGVDMSRELLRRSHVLVVCGKKTDETVKSDIATATRLKITATTLDGILTVKMQGQAKADD